VIISGDVQLVNDASSSTIDHDGGYYPSVISTVAARAAEVCHINKCCIHVHTFRRINVTMKRSTFVMILLLLKLRALIAIVHLKIVTSFRI
jgi:hypothetical protein